MFTGMAPVLQSEDAMAAVLGHEVRVCRGVVVGERATDWCRHRPQSMAQCWTFSLDGHSPGLQCWTF